MVEHLSSPTLLLDEDQCRANIQSMIDRCRHLSIALRPHFKTHQSHEVGRWFREAGVDRIAVSSLQMAEYFAADGWSDITLAFPVNIREVSRLRALASKIDLKLVVENPEQVSALGREASRHLSLFIKVDCGAGRTGLSSGQFEYANTLISSIHAIPHLQFLGFLAHAGHTYRSARTADIRPIHHQSMEVMQQFYDHFAPEHPGMEISYGDTPACSTQSFKGCATEWRPGNFTFYDLDQVYIGSCTPDQIAIAMACPVVALHPDRREAVIHGGAIHFSKDHHTEPDGAVHYGWVVSWTRTGWDSQNQLGQLVRLSQEHGIVQWREEMEPPFQVGDMVAVLPVHSCLTANLMKSYTTLSGHRIRMMPPEGLSQPISR